MEIKAALHHSSDSMRTCAEMKGAGRGKLIDADLICLNCIKKWSPGLECSLVKFSPKEKLFFFF